VNREVNAISRQVHRCQPEHHHENDDDDDDEESTTISSFWMAFFAA